MCFGIVAVSKKYNTIINVLYVKLERSLFPDESKLYHVPIGSSFEGRNPSMINKLIDTHSTDWFSVEISEDYTLETEFIATTFANVAKYGRKSIRTVPDESDDNNFKNFPIIEDRFLKDLIGEPVTDELVEKLKRNIGNR